MQHMKTQENYFELYSLPVSFSVDLNELAKRHRAMMQEFHPDRYVTADSISRRKSVQMATMLNEASTTLKTPVLRAAYLLELIGENVDDNTANDKHKTAVDSGFLMQQIEWREAIADVVTDKDTALSRLDSLHSEIQAVEQSLYQKFAISYHKKTYQSSREILQKLRFINKINNEIDNLEEKLELEFL